MSASSTIEAPPAAERGRARPRTLVITGAASRLGRLLAARLDAEPLFGRILGLDFVRPEDPPGRLETVALDLFSSEAEELLLAERPDAIAHLLWLPEPLDRAAAYRVNVLGTMRLAAVALRAGVRAIVFASSTAVYGASPRHPCFLGEDAAPAPLVADPEALDRRDAERQLLALSSELAVAVLRLAPILGPRAESSFAAWLTPRVAPTALGYDPRVQVLGEDDAVRALAHALLTRFSGTANVAAPGVLPVRRALRLAGRTALPLPRPLLRPALALHAVAEGRPHLRLHDGALAFPPIADTGRMERALGFRPAEGAFALFEGLAAGRPIRDDEPRERARLRAILACARGPS
jgi:UDP-glucose 4-epimerase